MKREDYIKQLHDDEVFKLVLSKATSDQERRGIQAFTEEFLLSFVGVVEELQRQVDADPDAFQKVLSELESQPLVTGSLEI